MKLPETQVKTPEPMHQTNYNKSIPSGGVILQVNQCYRKQDELQPGEPFSSREATAQQTFASFFSTHQSYFDINLKV
jgi:hypothetical protein